MAGLTFDGAVLYYRRGDSMIGIIIVEKGSVKLRVPSRIARIIRYIAFVEEGA